MNFNSPNVILVYYPAFAGGKFIINSLSLSRHCIIADPRFAEQDLAYSKFDDSFYKFKLDCVLKSLPSPDQIHNWRLYEFREWQFAGIMNNEYGSRSTADLKQHPFNPLLVRAVDSGRHHCFVSHYYDVTRGFKQVWTNAQIISLVNWNRFVKLAGKLKADSTDNIDAHLDYLLDHPSTLPWPALIYDVDHSIFSRENHLQAMQILYQALNWDDFDADLTGEYYDQYRWLHGF